MHRYLLIILKLVHVKHLLIPGTAITTITQNKAKQHGKVFLSLIQFDVLQTMTCASQSAEEIGTICF